MRPNRDEYLMGIAHAAKARGTCERLKVGAVLSHQGRVCGVGYNGAPAGMPHCVDVGCLMFTGHCIRTVHAEVNALLYATADGDTLYATSAPCLACVKALIARGVTTVIYDEDYRDEQRDEFLMRSGAASPIVIRQIWRAR